VREPSQLRRAQRGGARRPPARGGERAEEGGEVGRRGEVARDEEVLDGRLLEEVIEPRKAARWDGAPRRGMGEPWPARGAAAVASGWFRSCRGKVHASATRRAASVKANEQGQLGWEQ
jgi:hypothetical protein